jgi:hypothetical protein
MAQHIRAAGTVLLLMAAAVAFALLMYALVAGRWLSAMWLLFTTWSFGASALQLFGRWIAHRPPRGR